MITPTPNRTLTIPADAGLQNSVVLRFPNAFPASSLDYWLNVTNVVSYTDSVASFTFGPSIPSGLTITPINPALVSQPLIVGAFITGGVAVTQYQIPVSVTFASGDVFDTAVFLTVGLVAGAYPSGAGSVQSVAIATDGNLTETGSPITTAGTITLGLSTTGVTAGTYNTVTVDAYGRVTFGTNTYTGGGTQTSQSFLEQEDGTDFLILEDGSGSILLESSN